MCTQVINLIRSDANFTEKMHLPTLSCSIQNTQNARNQVTGSETNQNHGFPISRLPAELQQEIYAHYFRSLPPIKVTTTTLETQPQNQHLYSPLHNSSPYFISSIAPQLFYNNITFAFTSPKTLALFTSLSPQHQRIQHVRIAYGVIGKEGPDWVYALLSSLTGLASVVFVVDATSLERVGEEGFKSWLGCVMGAMREGVVSRMERNTRHRRNGVLITIEDDDGGVVFCERIDGMEKIKQQE